MARWIVEHNPEVRAERARVLAAHQAVSVAKLYQNPSLDLGVAGLAVGKPTPSSDLSYGQTISFGIGVSQTFEIGKRAPRTRAAQHRDSAEGLNYHELLIEKLQDGREALGRIAYLKARQQVLEERIEQAKTVIELDQIRLDRGDVSGTDHDRLLLEEASVQREADENRADLAEALAFCDVALSTSCAPFNPSLDQVEGATPLPGALPDAAHEAQSAPAILALREENAASQEDAKFWRKHSVPDPTVGISYTRDFYTYAGNQPHTLGVSASIPLPFFDNGSSQASVSEAEGQAAKAEADALVVQVAGESHGLVSRKAALEHKLELIQKDLLPRAQGVVKSADAGYQQGQLSMTDRLLVRRDLLALQLDELETRFNLFLVRSRLRRSLGIDAKDLASFGAN
ncbi:MAG TPA: TolC family protein [Polyangiaceae bacterium]|nr:TolC family protein [Polyangiaceae bacterium]